MPNLKYYIDFSDIESLQKDRKAEADTLNSMINALNAAISKNAISMLEYRTKLSEYLDINPDEIPEEPEPEPPPQIVQQPILDQIPQENEEQIV